MFWSTWPLNRCWVQGLGWAAETCSGSVDLSIQTEPSIIWEWQVWPWTPKYFICQQSLSTQHVHVRTSPGLKEVSHTFNSCLFHHLTNHPPPPPQHTQNLFFLSKSWDFFFNPSFLLFQNHQSIWKRFFAIIFNHMLLSQSRPALLLDHICMGFRFYPSSWYSAHAGSESKDHLDDTRSRIFF